MDATASREPLWDRACHIQAQMFEATAAMGGIEIQLTYYRGYGEFKAAPWAAEAEVLQNRMTSIRCAAGKRRSHECSNTRSDRLEALKVRSVRWYL